MTSLRIHAYPFELFLEGLLTLRLLLLFKGKSCLLLFEPRCVVAFERNTLSVVKLKNPARNIVEEVSIVRYGNHGAFVVVQVALKPRDTVGVKVVRWLVQEQDVGLL